MTIKELLEEMSYLSIDIDCEVIVRDGEGNYLELISVSEENSKCELIAL